MTPSTNVVALSPGGGAPAQRGQTTPEAQLRAQGRCRLELIVPVNKAVTLGRVAEALVRGATWRAALEEAGLSASLLVSGPAPAAAAEGFIPATATAATAPRDRMPASLPARLAVSEAAVPARATTSGPAWRAMPVSSVKAMGFAPIPAGIPVRLPAPGTPVPEKTPAPGTPALATSAAPRLQANLSDRFEPDVERAMRVAPSNPAPEVSVPAGEATAGSGEVRPTLFFWLLVALALVGIFFGTLKVMSLGLF